MGRPGDKNVKVSSYLAQYPVHRTAQSASPFDRPVQFGGGGDGVYFRRILTRRVGTTKVSVVLPGPDVSRRASGTAALLQLIQ